jgi:hypothetical protein
MTEFIVTLPIFLIIFSGILKLSKIQSTTVQLKVASLQEMWNDSVDVQEGDRYRSSEGPARWYHSPDAGRPSRRIVQNRDRSRGTLSFSDAMDERRFRALQSHGTAGEIEAMLEAQPAGDAVLDSTNLNDGDVRTRLTDTISSMNRWEASDGVFNDERRDIEFGNQHELESAFAGTRSRTGSPSTMAFGAGVRYGLIRARHDEMLRIAGMSLDLSTGYETLAPPVPMASESRARQTVGTARRSLEDHGSFGTVLGIEYINRLSP